MSQGLIVVTGATGNIGSELTRLLLLKGRKVRAIGRNAEKLKALALKGAETRAADLEDRAATVRAFAGASAAFAMIPPRNDALDFRAYQNKVSDNLAEAVKSAGVTHVVQLSSVGANLESGAGPVTGLHDSEKRFDALSASVVHLRPAYFMENHLNSVELIKHRGINGSGLRGDVRIPMIATRDIAAAAAELLAAATFTGKTTRELLGPRDYSMIEATRILGKAVGKEDLPYVQFSYSDVEKALTGMGFTPDMARLYVEMSEAFNSGRIRPTEPREKNNTTPTTLEQFVPAFAAAYSQGVLAGV